MVHELKILPLYFDAVVMREKTFEIRKNDRDFHVGDTLILKEWDGEKYTGRTVSRYVNYILYDWQDGLKDRYCIMNLKTSHAKAVSAQSQQVTGKLDSDCISRQAAIDALHRTMLEFFKTNDNDKPEFITASEKMLLSVNKAISKALKALPSAQPEPISEEYAKAVRTWLINYQVRCAELAGRYTPYEILGWIVSDWRKENEIW